MHRKIRIAVGSANVFADLGYRNPVETLAKAQLTGHIADILNARGLTQAETAKLLGVDEPRISALLRGQLRGFSYERLLRFLTTLGCDVSIVVSRTSKARRPKRGEILVKAA